MRPVERYRCGRIWSICTFCGREVGVRISDEGKKITFYRHKTALRRICSGSGAHIERTKLLEG